MKKAAIIITIIIGILLLNKSYYYFSYDKLMKKIEKTNNEVIKITQEKRSVGNYTNNNLKFDISLLSNKDVTCKENRCSNEDVTFMTSSEEDQLVEEPIFFGQEKNKFLYNLNQNDMENYFNKYDISYLSDFIIHLVKEDYRKESFLSSNNKIIEAIANNSFKNISIPKVEKTYIINDYIIAYKFNKDTYSIEFKQNDKYHSIMIKKELDEKGLLEFIKTIEVVSED